MQVCSLSSGRLLPQCHDDVKNPDEAREGRNEKREERQEKGRRKGRVGVRDGKE